MKDYDVMIQVNGGKLHCIVTGYDTFHDGAPIMLVLPGGPGFSLLTYKNNPNIQAFESVAHLIYMDPRNCGLSQGFSKDTCKLDDYVEDIDAVRNYFGLDRLSLLGTSYGSMAAIGYAGKYPDNVNKLILVAGCQSYHFLEKAKLNVAARGTAEQKLFCDKFLWPGEFTSVADVKAFFNLLSPLYSQKVAQGLIPSPYDFGSYDYPFELLNDAFHSQFWHFDYRSLLPHIKAATLIIFGEYDWINDPTFARDMAVSIADARLHILPDCGHSVSVDAPQVYQELISAFLQEN